MMKIVAMFDRGGDASELSNILELVGDAWNYFPHKIIGGTSRQQRNCSNIVRSKIEDRKLWPGGQGLAPGANTGQQRSSRHIVVLLLNFLDNIEFFVYHRHRHINFILKDGYNIRSFPTIMSVLRKKISENLIFFTLVLFVLISILGTDMSMKIEDGKISFCPFMDRQEAVCQMSAIEHITLWQKAFIGIPSKSDFFALAALLLVLIIIPFIKPFSQLKKLIAFTARLFVRRRTHLVIKFFDPLLLAFSNGILNPKIH